MCICILYMCVSMHAYIHVQAQLRSGPAGPAAQRGAAPSLRFCLGLSKRTRVSTLCAAPGGSGPRARPRAPRSLKARAVNEERRRSEAAL